MAKYNIAHQLDNKPRTTDVLLSETDDCDFASMLLPSPVLQGLTSAGFIRPSPIQLKAIPLARCGFDLIVQAKSGTGKTCVFSVPALESVKHDSKRLQVIVLAPTREIAQQIQHVISTIGSFYKNLKVRTFIGGVPLSEDKVNIVNCQIAVGAPGRLKHLIEDKLFAVDSVRLVVFDEADKLMEESFQNDINYIFQSLPESKQVIACSATYTDELLKFLGNYMQTATHVTPGQDPSPLLIGLRHYVFVGSKSINSLSRLKLKESCLLKILSNVPFVQCLVFSNYHSRAESICNGLINHGWKASWIAGKQDQQMRTSVMADMKDLKVRVLVTTDLIARGIDLHEVNLVINTDIPADYQTYLHRMGRAGRYGGHGMVITIITDDEMPKFRKLLGSIDGVYRAFFTSASVIEDSDLCETLWSKEISEFEQLYGVSSNNDDIMNVDETSRSSTEEQTKPVVSESSLLQGIIVKSEESENISSELNANDVKLDYKIGSDEIHVKVENINEEVSAVNSGDSDRDSNIDSSDFSGMNEEISDSDVDIEEEEDDEIKHQNAIKEYGLNMLNYSNFNTPNIQSLNDLEEALSDFMNRKLSINNEVCKSVLEPKGTVDVDAVEWFMKKVDGNYDSLIKYCCNLEPDDISNILSNDCCDDYLSKSLNSVTLECKDEKKSCKDPEYYSGSSSECDDDGKNDQSVTKIVEPNLTSNLNYGSIEPLVKSEVLSEDMNGINIEDECSKKRKTKRNELSASVSSIEEELDKQEKPMKQNCKKVKHTYNVDDTVGIKGTVLFSRERQSKSRKRKQLLHKNNSVSVQKQNDISDDLSACTSQMNTNEGVSNVFSDSHNALDGSSFSSNSPVSSNNSSPNNCTYNSSGSMPNEVQHWYDMWYKQEAQLKWCLGYSQYMNYMLNPKK